MIVDQDIAEVVLSHIYLHLLPLSPAADKECFHA